jgi:hypothetical protein
LGRLPEVPIGARRSQVEMKRVMHEKKMALNLVEGLSKILNSDDSPIWFPELYQSVTAKSARHIFWISVTDW